MNAIETSNLSKTFRQGRHGVIAVDQLTLTIPSGIVFGYVGPNGSGKTTTIRMLCGIIAPTSGTAMVAGIGLDQPDKVKAHIGYAGQGVSIYTDLSVEENLQFFDSVFGTSIEQNYELIRSIYEQIEPFSNRKAGQLSGGMKQKLALCCALIHRPRVLFLDEPTTGVDAVSRGEFWAMLKQIKSSGITTVVSTPYMEEAKLCDRVALIQKGSILTTDSPGSIEESYKKPLFAVRSSQKYRVIQSLRAFEHAESVYAFGDVAHYTDIRGSVSVEELRGYLRSTGFTDAEVTSIPAGIEDVFMAMTA